MTLQSKILSLSFVLGLLLFGSFSCLYFKWIVPQISAIEEKQLILQSHIPQKFFEQEKSHLAQLAHAIGLAITHLPNSDPKEAEGRIKTFKTLDVDWLFLLGSNEAPLFSMLVNPLFSKSSLHGLIQQLQKDYPFFLSKISGDAQTYLVVTSEGPALIGALRVPFPIEGIDTASTLLVGRFIDTQLKASLDQLLPATGYIWPLAQAPLSAAQSQLLNSFKDYPDGYVLTEQDDRKWKSFSALKDISGGPQVLLEAISPRVFDGVFFDAYLYFMSIGFVLFAILVVGLNSFLNKHLYRPLHKTLAQLSTWVEKTRIKGDLEVKGQHELDPLIQLINQVIKVINYHQNTALSHAFNEGLNQMRDNFIKEIKRLTKPIITNLTQLDAQMNDSTLAALETSLIDMLAQIPTPDVRTSFLGELKHRCNQLYLSQKSYQAKINDVKTRCLNLSTLLQAHTLNFEQIKQGESKATNQST